MASADKFRLASQKLDVFLFSKFHTVADLNQLFGRNGDKCDGTTELTADVWGDKAHRCSQHSGNLSVVSASVGSPCLAIGKWVIGDPEAIQLTDQCQCRSGSTASNLCFDPGNSEPGLGFKVKVI